MQSLAFGEAMKAAAEDYKKARCIDWALALNGLCVQEMQDSEEASRRSVHAQVDIGALANDPELQKLHAERLEEMKEAYEKRAEESTLLSKGHGRLSEIAEGEFLEIVTKTSLVVCHFFHQDFQRCKILDRHLESIARKYIKTRFIKLDATVSSTSEICE